MSGLLDLAARCEAAEGADRHLDEAIEKAMPCSPEFASRAPHAPKTLWNERGAAYHGALIGDLDDCSEYEPRRYTASIDAALTLLPAHEGVGWRVIDGAGGPTAEVWCFDFDTGKELYSVGANPTATPSLALVAAALRARAASVPA